MPRLWGPSQLHPRAARRHVTDSTDSLSTDLSIAGRLRGQRASTARAHRALTSNRVRLPHRLQRQRVEESGSSTTGGLLLPGTDSRPPVQQS